MAWATPKTDWTTADAIGHSDFNRIEENTVHLKEETEVFRELQPELIKLDVFTGTIPASSSGLIDVTGIDATKVVGLWGVYENTDSWGATYYASMDDNGNVSGVRVAIAASNGQLLLQNIGADARNKAYTITVAHTTL